MEDYPFLREVKSPITEDQLRPLDARCRVVQFSTPLKPADFSILASFLRSYPQVAIRIYGHYGRDADLEFLSEFKFIRRFQADVFQLSSFDGLRHLPENLEYLGLGQTKSKRHSLSVLRRFPNLQELYLESHTKDFAAIADLKELRDLTIRSITLPDLAILTGLDKLKSLDIKLGGTSDLRLLPQIGRLRYLELWMIKSLSDLSPIEGLHDLQYLFLQALKNVSALPSFRKLSRLRRLHLQTMKGLTDLQAVSEAPALEELVAGDLPQLSPEAFRPLVGHPRLRFASIGLGSARKNQAVDAMLGLPPVPPASTNFVFE